MASIGGTTVTIFNGTVPSLQARVECWEVAGYDGMGAQDTGQGHGFFRLHVEGYGAEATMNAWIAAMFALSGTTVDIVDGFGTTHSDVFIVNVRRVRKTAVGDGLGGSSYDTRAEAEILAAVQP